MIKIKKGGIAHPSWLNRGFRNVLSDCYLADLGLEGYPFTWARGKGKANGVEERLDRAMVTPSWLSMVPEARLRNLVAIVY